MSPELLRLILLAIALACFVTLFLAQRFVARRVVLELTGRRHGFARALWESWRHPPAARNEALERLRHRSKLARWATRSVMPLMIVGIAAAFLADVQLARLDPR
ncbi:MAG: hypothetical protein EA356_01335 [Geminicoccaceae bacterium]|nr:MAG: hypothetical protein EA356_01335 [Geminicoccaceae bacterium]